MSAWIFDHFEMNPSKMTFGEGDLSNFPHEAELEGNDGQYRRAIVTNLDARSTDRRIC